jgi:hypothetical protein
MLSDLAKMNLPDSSFVPFDVYRLSKFREAWRHPRLKNLDLTEYAVSVRESLATEDGGIRATALAELYGGSGVGSNGGGVRCGNIGEIQIKGIGRNPLAGKDTDYWHQQGAASLQDCVKEAIWGEILHSALPRGATRALAIIDCLETFEGIIDETQESVDVPRGLLLRETTIRLAHFMRSSFVNLSSSGSAQSIDIDRTARALHALPSMLGISKGRLAQAYVSALSGFIRASAEQLARARALRIVHGSHIPSNIGLFGEWLDFGTVTATASYAPVFVAPGADSSWNQQRAILEAVEDIVFYVYKYTGAYARKECEEISRALKEEFNAYYIECSKREFIQLIGISDWQLGQLPKALAEELWQGIAALLAEQGRTSYLYYGDLRHEMHVAPEVVDLNFIISSAVFSPNLEVADATCKSALALPLLKAIFKVLEFLQHRSPGSTADVRVGVGLRAYLVNCRPSDLYRSTLDNAIDRAVRAGESLSDFIDRHTIWWTYCLNKENRLSVPLDCWGIQAHIDQYGFVRTHSGNVEELLKFLLHTDRRNPWNQNPEVVESIARVFL